MSESASTSPPSPSISVPPALSKKVPSDSLLSPPSPGSSPKSSGVSKKKFDALVERVAALEAAHSQAEKRNQFLLKVLTNFYQFGSAGSTSARATIAAGGSCM